MAERKEALLEVVARAISKAQVQFADENARLSIGDFVRLLHLKKELAADVVDSVTVTWEEPDYDSEPVFAE
jgi:hypothetical protein